MAQIYLRDANGIYMSHGDAAQFDAISTEAFQKSSKRDPLMVAVRHAVYSPTLKVNHILQFVALSAIGDYR